MHHESWAKAEEVLQCGYSCPSLVTVRWPGTVGGQSLPSFLVMTVPGSSQLYMLSHIPTEVPPVV